MKFRCNWFLFLHSRPSREWLGHSSIGNQWFPSSKESLHATDLQICKILEILILCHDHWSCYGSDDHQTLSYPAVHTHVPCFWVDENIHIYRSQNCIMMLAAQIQLIISIWYILKYIRLYFGACAYHSLPCFTLAIRWSSEQIIMVRPNKDAGGMLRWIQNTPSMRSSDQKETKLV